MSISPLDSTSIQFSSSDNDQGWSDSEADAEWPDTFQDPFNIEVSKHRPKKWLCHCGVQRPPTTVQCTICKEFRDFDIPETPSQNAHIFWGRTNVVIIPFRFFSTDCMTQINPLAEGSKSEKSPIQVLPDSKHRFQVSVGETLSRFRPVSIFDYVFESKEEASILDKNLGEPYGTASSYIVEKKDPSRLTSRFSSKTVFAVDETRPNTIVEVHERDICDLSNCKIAKDFFKDSEIFCENDCPLYPAPRLVVRKDNELCGIYSEDDLWRLVGCTPLVGALLFKGLEVALAGVKIPSALVICLFEMAEGPVFVASMRYFVDCSPGIKEIYTSQWGFW